MTGNGITSRMGIAFVLATGVALSACYPPSMGWSPAESPKDIRVDWVNLRHDVGFAPGVVGVPAPARAEIDRFIAELGVGDRDRVSIVSTPTTALARQRRAALGLYLAKRHGIILSPPPRMIGPKGNALRLVVGRYILTPPHCPDWRKPTSADSDNLPHSNFRCADAVNLSRMVADPADLVRGRALAPADGAQTVLGIQRYRAGEVTPLDEDSETTGDGRGR